MHTTAMTHPPAETTGTSARAGFSKTAFIALMTAHCAGMVDVVALPVWVATLIGAYRLDAQHAGALPALFLAGVVASSAICARLLGRIFMRASASCGFAVAAVTFFYAGSATSYFGMATLHLLAGLAIGCSLSVAHGAIGRSTNPHRLFASAGLALGGFSLAFLGFTPRMVAAHGGAAFFSTVAGVMAFAAVVCALAFPTRTPQVAQPSRTPSKLARPVWFAVAGVGCMALTQAMLASFVARIGIERGFGVGAVASVLFALGVTNLLPAPLAALTQRWINARVVVLIGPIVQAALSLTITLSNGFAPYAIATAMFPAVMIFCHTYAFGLLAALDDSGRTTAATPAMVMAGAAIGPLLGGMLVGHLGDTSLGFAALGIGVIACVCFLQIPRSTLLTGHTP
ncbi:MFS transporter [Paraburkholderia xenovorans]|uniref:MFS transporter n=1 Tax=Paraburkholderia xenovorans TaxID=36873 RepID=UPI0038BC2734